MYQVMMIMSSKLFITISFLVYQKTLNLKSSREQSFSATKSKETKILAREKTEDSNL